MKSTVVKRSIVVGGHKTRVSLEEPFWTSMKEISQQLRVTLSELVSEMCQRAANFPREWASKFP